MDEEITKDSLYKWLMAVVFLGIMAIMTIYIAGLKNRLDILERQATEQQTIQQNEIDGLSLNIETVRNEMNAGFENQQKQIDSQQEQISTQKNVQSNTIKAFVRYQKEQAQTNEDFKEELKKD